MLAPFSLLVTSALLVAQAVIAVPLWTKGAIQKRLDVNLVVLQFAGVLEALESSFYDQGRSASSLFTRR